MRSPTTRTTLRRIFGLAGPAAGPNGGEILIDGFSGGATSAEKLDP